MEDIKSISDSFKEGLDSYNKKSSSPFSLSAIAANNGFKKIVSSLLLLTALSSSFSVQSQDIQRFESDVQIQNVISNDKEHFNFETLSANEDSTIQNENDFFDIEDMISHYNIKNNKYSVSKEQINTMNDIPFENIESGTYKNSFNNSFVSFIVKQDLDSKEHLKNDYDRANIDSGFIENVYDSILDNNFNKVNAFIPNEDIAYISDFKDHINDDYVNPSIIILNQEVNIFSELSHIENIDNYNNYFISVHETHHAATNNLVNSFEDNKNVNDFLDQEYENHTAYDYKTADSINKILESGESSADFAAIIKLADYMIDNGESMSTVNEVVDHITKLRHSSIDGSHYSTPVLSVAKEILNKNPGFYKSIDDETLFEISINVSKTAVEHDYKSDYLHNLFSNNANNSNTSKNTVISNLTDSINHGNLLFSQTLEKEDADSYTKIDGDLYRNKIQEMFSKMEIKKGESLFPELLSKVSTDFKQLGLKNTIEENEIINQLSSSSNYKDNISIAKIKKTNEYKI